MVKILASALGVCIILLVISVKMALSYHEGLSKADIIKDELNASLSQATYSLKKREESCRITDSIVSGVVSENATLKESTDVLLGKLDRLSRPTTMRPPNDKIIYADRINPDVYSLLRASYCETSGDRDYCSPTNSAN